LVHEVTSLLGGATTDNAPDLVGFRLQRIHKVMLPLASLGGNDRFRKRTQAQSSAIGASSPLQMLEILCNAWARGSVATLFDSLNSRTGRQPLPVTPAAVPGPAGRRTMDKRSKRIA
jgi:hypothetical protein